ncbi:MAG: PAS domain S-box protein, partial [Bacillota bacterium]|nr:PAS domain S-box protein [Bacillota bacterium]
MDSFIIGLVSKLEFNNMFPQTIFSAVLIFGLINWWKNKYKKYKNATTEELIKGITLSEERYRQLFNSGNDAIYLHDLNGKFLEVNDVACKMLGYSKKEFAQMTIADIDDPSSVKDNKASWRKLFEQGFLVCEVSHRKKDGNTVPVELSVKLIDLGGETLVLTHSRDITERKTAQEEIRRRNQELVDLYKKEQEKTAIIQACHNIGHTLSSSVELSNIMTDFYDELLRLVQFDQMWLILIEGTDVKRTIETYTVNQMLTKLDVHSYDNELWKPLENNQELLHTIDCSLFNNYISISTNDCYSQAYPLISNNKLIGLIILVNNKTPFSQRDFDIGENLTNHLALAIDNSRLQTEVEKLAIKNERSRLAREFHDSVAQNISAIRAKVEYATKLLQLKRYEEVEETLIGVERIASEVRESIFGLKSTIDLTQGLVG